MKQGRNGFIFIELVVAITITALVGSAAAAATFQIFRSAERNNDYMTAVRQVQNAGYRISHDAQMAESVAVDNLEPSEFLVLTWTEWDYAGEPTYHSVTYSFEGLTDGIGSLKRSHWSDAGANEQTLVAEYVYYDPADPDNTSKASYLRPMLTVQITTLSGEARETREYRIKHRPNF